MWLFIWLIVTAAGFYFGGVVVGVILSLVVGLLALLRSGKMNWK